MGMTNAARRTAYTTRRRRQMDAPLHSSHFLDHRRGRRLSAGASLCRRIRPRLLPGRVGEPRKLRPPAQRELAQVLHRSCGLVNVGDQFHRPSGTAEEHPALQHPPTGCSSQTHPPTAAPTKQSITQRDSDPPSRSSWSNRSLRLLHLHSQPLPVIARLRRPRERPHQSPT